MQAIRLALNKYYRKLRGMDTSLEPKLDPPGAGLPAVELRIARLMFAWQFLTGNREKFTARFQRERDGIRALIRGVDAERGARRILIQRLPGMEDSSRHWSVWMTLEHLRIVNGGITRTIASLLQGVVPQRVASTAAVKPSPDATIAVVPDFEKSCDDLVAIAAEPADLNTTARYAHPWFGLLNAAGWHAIAGIHLGLHRAQIERILAET
jgi:DinB superfamily